MVSEPVFGNGSTRVKNADDEQADVLVEYLRDYAKALENAGRMRYRTTTQNIARNPTAASTGFVLTLSVGSADGGGGGTTVQTAECGTVVVATGLGTPNIPTTIPGIELTIGYEDLSVSSVLGAHVANLASMVCP
jgi:glycine/D-amino acid oxidase-like deaminating enzyme